MSHRARRYEGDEVPPTLFRRPLKVLVCRCGHGIDDHSDYYPCACLECECNALKPLEETMYVEEDSDRAVKIPGAKAIRATPAALVVVIDGKEHLVPQSQIHEDSEVFKPGTDGDLVVSRWLAEQRGWV